MSQNSSTHEKTSDRRFQLLVASIHDYAIYLLDLAGHVTSWNPGAERFKGYAAAEIMGQHFCVFYTDEERAAGVPARALREARENGKFEAEGWRVRKGRHALLGQCRDRSGARRGRYVDRLCQDHARHVRPARRASGPARERGTLPAACPGRYRLRDLHALAHRHRDQLERRRRADQGLFAGRSARQPFFAFLYGADRAQGLPGQALAAALAEGRYEQEGWPRAQGRLAILGARGDRRHSRSGRTIDWFC